jgi:hypothetical protein
MRRPLSKTRDKDRKDESGGPERKIRAEDQSGRPEEDQRKTRERPEQV